MFDVYVINRNNNNLIFWKTCFPSLSCPCPLPDLDEKFDPIVSVMKAGAALWRAN